MAAGVVVFDYRPAVLPVSVDVSGIDMQTVRRAEPPAESVVTPAERKQEFRGRYQNGGKQWRAHTESYPEADTDWRSEMLDMR